MEKYKRDRKSLYLLFVDFRQAFDRVWHAGLLYKLAKAGVSNRFYAVIKNMYSKIEVAVQRDEVMSPYFHSKVGVRQGDNLSPTLFNVFSNDIPMLFGPECCPANFGDLPISCLMYADDLVVLSESTNGLQRATDKLSRWCKTWALEIKISKPKLCSPHPHLKI